MHVPHLFQGMLISLAEAQAEMEKITQGNDHEDSCRIHPSQLIFFIHRQPQSESVLNLCVHRSNGMNAKSHHTELQRKEKKTVSEEEKMKTL